MNTDVIKYFVAGLVLSLGINDAAAETRYVSDELSITFSIEPNARKRILEMLKSGTPLEVISVDKTNGYAKVLTKDGQTGFVLEHFLSEEPSARAQLLAMRERLLEQEVKLYSIRSELNSTSFRRAIPSCSSTIKLTMKTNACHRSLP